MKGRVFAFCAVFFLACGFSLFAAKKDVAESFNLKEESTDWNVAVFFFSTQNISLENRYLASSLPLKIYTALLDYQTHTLSTEERLCYAEKIIDSARQGLLKEASEWRQSLDNFDFEVEASASLPTRQKKEWELLQKGETLNEKFQYLREVSPSDLDIAEEKKIVLLRESDSQELFSPIKDKWDRFAADKKADLLVFGGLEEMAGYIYYRIAAYSSILNKLVFEVEGGGAPDKIEQQVDEHLKDLITVAVGSPWSDFTVTAMPVTASIRIGDLYRGSGVYRNNQMPPGTYTMTVEAPGYIGEEIELILNPKETQTLSVALIRNPVPPVVINTVPPGADVYLSSLWVGATPFLVENGGVNEPLMLKKEGYLDFVSALNPSAQNELNFVLRSSAFDIDSYMKSKRRDFYFNIAGLALSIPLTILTNGYQTRFLNSIPEATESNAVQRQQIIFGYKAMATVFSVSIVLNAIMATGLIVDMIDYVKVYDSK